MLLHQSIEHVSIVYTCNTYFVMHWSMLFIRESLVNVLIQYMHLLSTGLHTPSSPLSCSSLLYLLGFILYALLPNDISLISAIRINETIEIEQLRQFKNQQVVLITYWCKLWTDWITLTLQVMW